VDNARAGKTHGDYILLDDAGLTMLLAREPRLVGVMCCCSDRAVDHFRRLWPRSGRPLLSLFQAMRHVPVSRPDDFSDPASVAALFERESLWRNFADEESRRAFLSVLLYRLTWDRRWADDCRLSCASMYFFTDAMDVAENEILVDGGAFDGDTVAGFAERTNGRYRHIHAFELDPANLDALRRRVMPMPRVTIHPVGLWSGHATLNLAPGHGATTSPGENDRVPVPVEALDQLGLGPVSFIKLDIDGAERLALQGAVETIRRHKPKLSLAVSHAPDDLAAIPELITAIRPDYCFRLRHHSPIFHDTVLYAA
jgi:FkbM family methyltransferase